MQGRSDVYGWTCNNFAKTKAVPAEKQVLWCPGELWLAT